MEAVIDPAGPTIVGQVPLGACRHGGAWADFVTAPIPDGLEGKSIKAEIVDDVWVISLDVDTVTAAAWTSLRAQRNDRLTASDWTQLQDTHMSADKQAAWADYRQELRDLPDLITDPTVVTWPLKPGEIPPTPVASSRFGSLLEHAVEEVPVAEPVEEVPVAEPVEEVPVAEPVEEVTVAEPVEEVPVAEPVEEVTGV
jgi:hypothetical protein